MKRILISLFAVFLSLSVLSQERIGFTENVAEDKSHTYSTTIASLYNRRVWEEVVILNNSSYELHNVSCTIEIDGYPHPLVNISRIKIGDDESFDGYEDDELKDELPYYFGDKGKFKFGNNSRITFKLNFGSNNNNVRISRVQDKDKDLMFVITDASDAVKPEEKIEALGGNVIEIDEKKFLLFNGQAYQVK